MTMQTRETFDTPAAAGLPAAALWPDEHATQAAWSPARQPPWSPPPGALQAAALAQLLDEIDYGLLVLDAQERLLYANHAARAQLDEGHPLQVQEDGRLRAGRPRESAALRTALEAARQRGLRTMVALSDTPQQRSTVTVMAMPPAVLPCAGGEAAGPAASVLVVLGKRRVCEELTAVSFGKAHGLTAAETRVLLCLCNGDSPAETAQRNGVKVSTTRTHIASIRTKLGARNLDELVRTVAVLPPVMGSLRRGPWTAGRQRM